MKYFFITYIFAAIIVVSAAGLRGSKSQLPPIEIFDDLDHQAKIKYQTSSTFFADGVGTRPAIRHTVPVGFEMPKIASVDKPKPPAFGFANGIDFYSTGKVGDYYGDGFPTELDLDFKLVERGQQRFNIYCSVCHGLAGNGKGITSKYGILTAYNFQQPGAMDPANVGAYRPNGAIFDTITNGKGLMGPYGGAVPVRDRWAIIAYIRTLQTAGKTAGVQ
jgi:mono/diheme cytochrome c family protein